MRERRTCSRTLMMTRLCASVKSSIEAFRSCGEKRSVTGNVALEGAIDCPCANQSSIETAMREPAAYVTPWYVHDERGSKRNWS